MALAARIASFIASERLLEPGARVIVGLSGGADSSALLLLLHELGYGLIAAHCHFGLRPGEADRDLAHSRTLAERVGAEFRSVRFDTRAEMARRGVSAEMACRDLRYDYFEQLRLATGAAAIATGHHRDDNVETFFLNLLRGSGLHGLRAMEPRRDHIVRPLLETPRADLEAYLRERGVEWVTDSTNADNAMRRNRLRNVVVPALEREFPGASERIAASLRCLRGNDALYRRLLPPFEGTIEGAEPTLVHEWLEPFGFNSAQTASAASADAGATFESPTHRLTLLPGGRVDLRAKGAAAPGLRLAARVVRRDAGAGVRPGVLSLDADALPADALWELRPWRPGDRMCPFGMAGSKAVADLLAAAGVAADRRAESLVLTVNGEIVWAVGVRASALYPVTHSTLKILEIELLDHETT